MGVRAEPRLDPQLDRGSAFAAELDPSPQEHRPQRLLRRAGPETSTLETVEHLQRAPPLVQKRRVCDLQRAAQQVAKVHSERLGRVEPVARMAHEPLPAAPAGCRPRKTTVGMHRPPGVYRDRAPRTRQALAPLLDAASPMRDWRAYLDHHVDDSFRVPRAIVEKYGKGFHVVDDDATYTTCFTGSYGKSWNFTGSYLRLPDGGLRLFTPREVLRFLHFPDTFAMPAELTTRQQWKYAGNSLSAVCVRHALEVLL